VFVEFIHGVLQTRNNSTRSIYNGWGKIVYWRSTLESWCFDDIMELPFRRYVHPDALEVPTGRASGYPRHVCVRGHTRQETRPARGCESITLCEWQLPLKVFRLPTCRWIFCRCWALRLLCLCSLFVLSHRRAYRANIVRILWIWTSTIECVEGKFNCPTRL